MDYGLSTMDCKLWTIDYGLWSIDYGLWTMDYRLSTIDCKLAAMKIGMFLDNFFPPDSRVENEAYSLIRAGHRVYLFSLDYQGIEPNRENIRGIEVCRYRAGWLTYKLSALACSFPFFHRIVKKKIRHFLSEIQPDALHVHDIVIARAVMDANAQSINPLPVTLDLHENRPEIMRFYPHLKRFPGKYLINIDRWHIEQKALIKRADKVVLVTPEAVEVAVSTTGEPVSKFLVIPNTIEKDIYFNYPVNQKLVRQLKKGFNLVYTGDTGLRRGTDTAIRALSKVIELLPEARLILVGKSTEDEVLKALVMDLGLAAYVIFEGWQDVSLFPSYIQGAAACISPLKRNLHHDTTYANKLFQYMAGKRPLLVSDCTAQAQLVKQVGCGMVHEAENAQALADCLLYLYQNPTEAKRMGERGYRAVVDTYHWQQTSQPLINHYGQLSARSDQ